ncbi:MAG: hypothetical protein K6C36_07075, partial [Clostridia bacterium]|nr:hypothetical protein [Clostridia bacterium]
MPERREKKKTVQKYNSPRYKYPLSGLLALFLLLLIIGAGGLIRIGAVKADKYKLASQYTLVSDSVLTPQRGSIYDADMNVLARTALLYDCFIDAGTLNGAISEAVSQDELAAEEWNKKSAGKKKNESFDEHANESLLRDNLEELYARLVDTLGVERERIDSALETNTHYTVLKKEVSAEAMENILSLTSELRKREGNAKSPYFNVSSFIGFDKNYKRYYPAGSFASQVVGFTT